MLDYTQSEFIESEKFESDFYFDYINMINEYESQYILSEDIEIDYDITEILQNI